LESIIVIETLGEQKSCTPNRKTTTASNYLTNEIRRFTEERDWDKFHSPENLAKSVAIEAGELLECF
jgi:hypothetical protein